MAGAVAVPTNGQTRTKPTDPAVARVLKETINSASVELLRNELGFLCEKFPAIIDTLKDRLLVRGKDVVRYHFNSDSESDSCESEEEDDSEDDDNENDDDEGDERMRRKRKPIAIGDDGYTARIAQCENCNEEFDVTWNDNGECFWHPGDKEVDYDSEMWWDHDEDCHGRYESFEDDNDYAEGFVWNCCERPGDDKGCKRTKHKARANLIVPAPLPVEMPSKKRGAEEEVPRAGVKKGRQA